MRFLRFALSVAVVLVVASLQADEKKLSSDECQSILRQGRQALDGHRFSAATEAFDRINRDCAHAQGTFQGDHAFQYYAALARTLDAQFGSYDDTQRTKLLNEAATLYEEALSTKPGDLSVLNNLAEVYGELKRNDDADKTFRKVIEIGGSNPWFRASYAEFLVGAGRLDEAAAILGPIVKETPSLLQAQVAMFELRCRRDGVEAARTDLSRLAVTQPEIASQVAIDSLRMPALSDMDKELSFALAVSSLGTVLAQRSSAQKEVINQLEEAQRTPLVGPAAGELRSIFDGKVDDTSFPWWAKTANNDSPVNRALWQAFQSFALAAGRAALRDGQHDRAADLYVAIMKLQRPAVSIEPILGIAEVLTATNDAKGLIDHVQRYDTYLTAPSTEQDPTALRKRYDYHREIAFLGDALLRTSCTDAANTTAECRSLARLVVGEVDKATAAVVDPNKLDAGALSAAGHAYVVADQPKDAASVLLRAAYSFRDANKPLSALREIDKIESSGLKEYLSTADQAKFADLKTTLGSELH